MEHTRPIGQPYWLFRQRSQGWTRRQILRARLQTTLSHRFKDYASFGLHFCFRQPERTKTLSQHAGKTKLILKQSAARLKRVIADSQYSDGKLRNAVDAAVIPYRSNQKRGVKGLLRVDRKFRTYGPEDQKKQYHKRPRVEAIYSFLKTQYGMAINKVRGVTNVASYALLSILCLILNREATENIGRKDKAVSPTYFNT